MKEKIKKIGLIIYYILIWLLFIFNAVCIFGLINAILDGIATGIKDWFIAIAIITLPFLWGYLLRNHFKVLAKLMVNFFSFIRNIKLTLPVTILLSCIILGGFFYASQVSKQKSTERQQQIELQAKKADEAFNNNLKCQNLLKDLKERYSNVVGIYYKGESGNMFKDILLGKNTCIVKYTKDGETLEAPIEHLQDIK